ncbi:nucleic acid-binding, OB-fold protein [Artemisia annua]|uniref:Nucleic acid-binding, OB-fold protein n=1 Tax=Artemisia annua TaxID=35608 RepID=A0A2U1L4P5_ARTAN|nr:nucleic acid-binding, OB-fold protein [Artemisia annua]
MVNENQINKILCPNSSSILNEFQVVPFTNKPAQLLVGDMYSQDTSVGPHMLYYQHQSPLEAGCTSKKQKTSVNIHDVFQQKASNKGKAICVTENYGANFQIAKYQEAEDVNKGKSILEDNIDEVVRRHNTQTSNKALNKRKSLCEMESYGVGFEIPYYEEQEDLRRKSIPENKRKRPTTQTEASMSINHKGLSSLYIDIGDCDWTCEHCNAAFWYGERLKRSTQQRVRYSRCCAEGKVHLPEEIEPPETGAREYQLPSTDILGAIVFEDGPNTQTDYDVIIHKKGVGPQRISKLHSSYMSLQFPLLFVHGEPGYTTKLTLRYSMELAPIEYLKPGHRDKMIEVKVYRAWTARDPPDRTEKGYRAILLDRQGDAIQANIDATDIYHFKPMLIPGTAYRISNFLYVPTDNWQQTLHNKTSLLFNRLFTKLQSIPAESFPNHYFSFVSYNQLPNKLWDPRDKGKKPYPVLTDYIGCYITAGEPRDIGNPNRNVSRMRKVEIQNLNRNVIELTLWDELADKFEKNEIETLEKPIIIAVSSCRVSKFQNRDLQLQSTPATYYYINPKIPQLNEYIQQYKQLYEENPPLSVTRYRLPDIEQEKNKNRFPLAVLLTQTPETYRGVRFTCEGTIMQLNTNRDWYYKACNQCNVKPTCYDNVYECKEHGIIPAPSYRYNFRATITDNTATGQFTFFTPKADEFVGVDCARLASSAENRGPRQFPDELHAIVGKKHTFQFHYTPTSRQGSVEFIVDEIFEIEKTSNKIEGQSSGTQHIQATKPTAIMEPLEETITEAQHSEEIASPTASCTTIQSTSTTDILSVPTELIPITKEMATPPIAYTGMQTRSKTDMTSDASRKIPKRQLFTDEASDSKKKKA